MHRTIVVVAAAAFLAVSVAPSFGGEVVKREERQERHIEKGVKRGSITPKEEQRLENEQKQIEGEREDALKDGKMTKRERQDIRHDQKRLHQDIRKKKHNARDVKK